MLRTASSVQPEMVFSNVVVSSSCERVRCDNDGRGSGQRHRPIMVCAGALLRHEFWLVMFSHSVVQFSEDIKDPNVRLLSPELSVQSSIRYVQFPLFLFCENLQRSPAEREQNS